MPTDRLIRFFEESAPSDVVSAYLFGSHAHGTAHRESDVDLGVVLRDDVADDAKKRVALVRRLGSDLIRATHRDDLQLVLLNRAPPELCMAALAGVRLYCADPEADHAFLRRILLRNADLQPFLRRTRRIKAEALRR